GSQVVQYSYDAWGTVLSVTGTMADTIGQKNPLRYRGYYYDTETGFYYCISRYYDSVVGRWINADGVISGIGTDIRGYNQFAYCFNNPVNMSDPSGNWPSWNDVKSGLKKAASWVDNNIIQPVKSFINKAVEVVPTEDFANEVGNIVKNNISASAGLCVGIGFNADFGQGMQIEAIIRGDIVGVQLREGEIKFGHNLRSSFQVGYGAISVGSQSDVFESFGGKERILYDIDKFDIGLSSGKALVPIIGYHYDFSISYIGIFSDIVSYINDY
ncbi:MAG: RHS repeat-associated core domain-containing protein, partial [Acutalibacteraceae bacterium]|nr:RHS repeat-associated core domain-containing protein [Acutalibacteraceae bacterium]